ncbi:MAG: DUF2799 domain-containing protein [Pseudomonadota bacterium]
MPYRFPFLAAGALAVLAACEPITEDECRAGDWRGIGVADGASGRSPDRINAYAETCAKIGIVPDARAWRAGREEGLKRYCTPENAYRIGRNGTRLAPYCPAGQRAVLSQANITGLQYHELSTQIEQLGAQANDLDRQIRDISDFASEEELRDRRQLRRERSRIQERLRELRFQRIQYSEYAA